MPTTSNFGWNTPADTDLVKDGAAAIRTLGNNIDASLVDLKGGTTGQVLAKATNTDLDFTWVTQDDANAIQNTIVDAKGDLITATAADVPARLASSGVNGDVLTVDTSTATGLKWAAATSGGMTVLASGSLSGTTLSLTSINQTYRNLRLVLRDVAYSGDTTIRLRVNNNSTGLYASTAFNSDAQGLAATSTSSIIGFQVSSSGTDNLLVIDFDDYSNTTTWKFWRSYIANLQSGGSTYSHRSYASFIRNTSAISRIDVLEVDDGTYTLSGTYILYGVS